MDRLSPYGHQPVARCRLPRCDHHRHLGKRLPGDHGNPGRRHYRAIDHEHRRHQRHVFDVAVGPDDDHDRIQLKPDIDIAVQDVQSHIAQAQKNLPAAD